jgi:hypothetical protein
MGLDKKIPFIAGYVGIVPALSSIGHPVSYWHLIFWSLGVAFFGVFFAVPLRTQTVSSSLTSFILLVIFFFFLRFSGKNFAFHQELQLPR